jgi:hypothetical protein
LSAVVADGDGVRMTVSDNAIWTGRDKPRRLEASLDILLREYCRPDLCIDCEEVYLVDMVDALASEIMDLVTIHALKWREAAYIKRL